MGEELGSSPLMLQGGPWLLLGWGLRRSLQQGS